MKILFDARVHLNYFSGISRYIICLLDAYARLFPEDELTVLLNPTIQSDNSIYKTLEHYPNVRFKTVDAGHMGPKNYLVMGGIIKKMAPDVYHYPHLDAPVFTGKIPVVATVHDINSNEKVKKFDDKWGLKQHYFKQALKQTLKRSARVIFVSDSVKEEVTEAFKAQKLASKFQRIYNGLEPDFNQITPADQANVLKELDINQPYVLFVGQIREHKNIRRIIEAFKKVSPEYANHQLVLVGHNYLQLDLSADNIRHFEKVSNHVLKALYAQCNAFLFPSLFEGFGFPILEAFSFGRPVITTNYGATKEISGNLAELVDPYSVDSIADGLRRALESKPGKNEERIAHTRNFTWEANATALKAIYESVVEG